MVRWFFSHSSIWRMWDIVRYCEILLIVNMKKHGYTFISNENINFVRLFEFHEMISASQRVWIYPKQATLHQWGQRRHIVNDDDVGKLTFELHPLKCVSLRSLFGQFTWPSSFTKCITRFLLSYKWPKLVRFYSV